MWVLAWLKSPAGRRAKAGRRSTWRWQLSPIARCCSRRWRGCSSRPPRARRVPNCRSILRRAGAIEPEYVDLHYQLGLAFAKRQQFDMTVEQFEHAVSGTPQQPDFHANLALALQHLGLIDRANACWESVRALTAPPRWM